MSGRVIKGVRGDHSPAVEVGGEHEGVPLDPVHGGQGLRLPALLQSPEVVLRLVKLLGEVPVEVHSRALPSLLVTAVLKSTPCFPSNVCFTNFSMVFIFV